MFSFSTVRRTNTVPLTLESQRARFRSRGAANRTLRSEMGAGDICRCVGGAAGISASDVRVPDMTEGRSAVREGNKCPFLELRVERRAEAVA